MKVFCELCKVGLAVRAPPLRVCWPGRNQVEKEDGPLTEKHGRAFHVNSCLRSTRPGRHSDLPARSSTLLDEKFCRQVAAPNPLDRRLRHSAIARHGSVAGKHGKIELWQQHQPSSQSESIEQQGAELHFAMLRLPAFFNLHPVAREAGGPGVRAPRGSRKRWRAGSSCRTRGSSLLPGSRLTSCPSLHPRTACPAQSHRYSR